MKLQICVAPSVKEKEGVFATVEMVFDDIHGVEQVRKQFEQIANQLSMVENMLYESNGRRVCIPMEVEAVEIVNAFTRKPINLLQ
jgi:hypothetical protein